MNHIEDLRNIEALLAMGGDPAGWTMKELQSEFSDKTRLPKKPETPREEVVDERQF